MRSDESGANHPRSHVASAIDFSAIERYWETSAADYDDYLGGTDTAPQHRRAAEVRAWELLLRRILGPPPLRILDVGTGTGSLALLLALLGYQVTALDAAPHMLQVAAAKAERLGLRLELRQGIAEDLPFEGGSFDAITCKLLLWTLLDPEAAVREWRRCVRPGGRIVAIDGTHGQRENALDRVRSAVAARIHGHRDGYMQHPEQIAQLPLWHINSPEAYRNVFVRAGLEQVLVEELAGIDVLERRQWTMWFRIWPRRAQYLIEGAVPSS
ncbi:MAG: class I SAM-dependent methyltransferase [Pseudonocardiaceae bacterium]